MTRQPLRNTETGEEAWIELLSAGRGVRRAPDRAVTDRQLRLRGQRYTAEQAEADLIEKLAKLTKAWALVTLDGTAPAHLVDLGDGHFVRVRKDADPGSIAA